MSTADSTLTLLQTCGEPIEASVLRSLLDANDIPCVVQGEHHRGMLGTVCGGAIIELRVLVAGRDLERARALLASEVETPREQDSEEAVCPVHGERSTATCGRCGTFLCARCRAEDSNAPVCEDCAEREAPCTQVRRSHRRKLAAWFALGCLFGPFPLM